jgi:hypothetical protein
VGKVRTSLSEMSVAALPQEKTKKHYNLKYARNELSRIGLKLV